MHLIWNFYSPYQIFSNGFESYYFVVSQRSKQPKNVQFEPIIEQEQYDLLLAALCSGRRSPLPFFFCENKDGRWSTRGRRILGEDGGGGFQTAPPLKKIESYVLEMFKSIRNRPFSLPLLKPSK